MQKYYLIAGNTCSVKLYCFDVAKKGIHWLSWEERHSTIVKIQCRKISSLQNQLSRIFPFVTYMLLWCFAFVLLNTGKGNSVVGPAPTLGQAVNQVPAAPQGNFHVFNIKLLLINPGFLLLYTFFIKLLQKNNVM